MSAQPLLSRRALLALWRGCGKISGLWLFILIVLVLVVVPPLLAHGPRSPDWEAMAEGPSWRHWLGTDAIGRDLLARTLAGGQISLWVGGMAALGGLLVGTVVGAWAGWRGGIVDMLFGVCADVLTSLPFLLIVVLILSAFSPTINLLIMVIAGYVWIDVARIVRPEAQRLSGLAFMQAGQILGLSDARLFWRHLLPNLLPQALLSLSQTVPAAILMESFLSFLGLSPLQDGASLGSLVAEGVYDVSTNPGALLAPITLMVLLLYAMQEIADSLSHRLSHSA